MGGAGGAIVARLRDQYSNFELRGDAFGTRCWRCRGSCGRGFCRVGHKGVSERLAMMSSHVRTVDAGLRHIGKR